MSLSRLKDLNRGSEWDFGSEKDIIVIAFLDNEYWILLEMRERLNPRHGRQKLRKDR